jgi:U5 small nuclear ribonucleoprotein component
MDQAERDADARGAEGDRAMGDDENSDDNDYEKSAIVLAEDKKYYPSAEEVYGAGTETLVMDEDAQPLEEPIIAPLRHKKVEVRDANVPQMSNVSETYLLDMLRNPNLTRNVAVCGHLHRATDARNWRAGGKKHKRNANAVLRQPPGRTGGSSCFPKYFRVTDNMHS